MKTYAPGVVVDHSAGRIDAIDALTLVLDSGVVNLAIGVAGTFVWDDPAFGPMTFVGAGGLVTLDVPENALGPQSQAITATLFETYMAEGSDIPVNVFDDGVRASIDEEVWEGRIAIPSIFWLDENGSIMAREQVAVRQIDSMAMQWDDAGNPMRIATLEEPDITQRDIEGKTSNAEFQALIDPTDRSHEHIGTAKNQKINFGKIADKTVG